MSKNCYGYISTTGNYHKPCTHRHCLDCVALSLPERSSDFWLCCRCYQDNPYDMLKREAELARRHTLRFIERNYSDDAIYD
jgi:hypothetical protein